MSRTLIKKEEYPGLFKGLLIAFTLSFLVWYFHPKTEKVPIGSLPLQVACISPSKELITLDLAEDILDSEPVPKKITPKDKPEKTSQKKSVDDNNGSGTKTGAERTTYITPPYITPEVIQDPGKEEEVIVEPEEPIVTTQEGDVVSNEITVPFTGTSTVIPDTSTERDAEIISTITIADDSQNTINGALRAKIERKFKAY